MQDDCNKKKHAAQCHTKYSWLSAFVCEIKWPRFNLSYCYYVNLIILFYHKMFRTDLHMNENVFFTVGN